jgi:hypothetical protein
VHVVCLRFKTGVLIMLLLLQASFKAALEACRCMTLPYQSYIHIQANALMLRQVRMSIVAATECFSSRSDTSACIFCCGSSVVHCVYRQHYVPRVSAGVS